MSVEPGVPGKSPGDDGWSSAVPDEVWEQFARDHEGAIRASAPKEPSARARQVTARLREQDEAAAAAAARKGLFRRGRSKSNPPAQPDGWRTGPAWQETNGRADRKRKILACIGVLAAVGATVLVLNPHLVLGRTTGSAVPTPLPPETARPTAAPSAPSDTAPSLDRPFAGSPAEQYADGAAGIVLPDAAPVGSASKDEVASALARTKDFLVAANLDPGTLRGERPARAVELLDPLQDDVYALATTALGRPTREQDPLLLLSRFDPGETRPVGGTVKTRGRMTVGPGADGVPTIHADYTFVYALTKKAPDSREIARTVVRRVLDIEIPDPGRYRVTPGRLVVRSHKADFANSACGVHDGFLHPEFGPGSDSGPQPSGPAVDPYDRSRELGEAKREECGTVTRT
ncbi:hypothetical protein ACFP1Z_16325 [Streptomyces gamaensis]|uniref:Uncharacterized protein n=1 Tax=Streptomyces gamaensis TaxID=1763542 RepID=A0ABW0YYQ6_9ACTN